MVGLIYHEEDYDRYYFITHFHYLDRGIFFSFRRRLDPSIAFPTLNWSSLSYLERPGRVKLNQVQLPQGDATKWRKNLQLFLIPLVIAYLVSLTGILQQNNTITPQDFIPNQFTLGATSLYLINAAIDYLRKLKASLES